MVLRTTDGRSPVHWDFIVTCFEPLNSSSGGIGTYTRLLCENLNDAIDESNAIKVLLLCGFEPDFSIRRRLEKVTIRVVNFVKSWFDSEIQYIGDHQPRFSLALAQQLVGMQAKGDTFGLFEFPDYFTEGFFPIKYRRQGFIKTGTTAVRLHSPSVMLFQDNCVPLSNYDTYRRYIIDMEIYCYRFADIILYGVEAMRDRICFICGNFDLDVSAKCRQVHHPYNMSVFGAPGRDLIAPERANNKELSTLMDDPSAKLIGYVGRLETRKGIVRFFETISKSDAAISTILRNNLHFALFGRDLPDENNVSNASVIRALAKSAGIESRVHIAGNVAHDTLVKAFIPWIGAFVFPSLFENYPNSLIETIAFGRPTLVSSRGGMPEIASGFDFIKSYDPLHSESVRSIELFLDSVSSSYKKSETKVVFDKFVNINKELSSQYKYLLDYYSPRMLTPSDANCGVAPSVHGSVGFVIPYFNDSEFIEGALSSLSDCCEPNDKIVVVDDASRDQEAQFLRSLRQRYKFEVLTLTNNSGPACARNAGSKNIGTDYIQFLDADDMLDAVGFKKTREILDIHQDIDMSYGLQQCFGDKQHVWVPRDSTVLNCLDENYAHSAVIIRRRVFEQLGGYNEEMRYHYEDWEFYVRFCFSGKRSEVVPIVTQMYRVRVRSRTFDNIERDSQSRKDLVKFSLANILKHSSVAPRVLAQVIAIYYSRLAATEMPEPDFKKIRENIKKNKRLSPLTRHFARRAARWIESLYS